MQRRTFVASLAAGAGALALTRVSVAAGVKPYSRSAYEQALKSGEPFLLDFYADW